MSWPGTPKTWTNVLVDAADLNAEIRDRMNVLKTSINDDGSLKIGLDRSTTEQDVVNTVTETSVYSFSVPGGTIGTNKILRLTVNATYLNNSGGADTFTPRVKFGGTTIATGAPSLGAGANRRTMKFIVEINANGLTNSQRAVTIWIVGGGQTENNFDVPVSLTEAAYNGSLALDSTGALTLTLTVQHGTAASTISFKRFSAMLELLGQ